MVVAQAQAVRPVLTLPEAEAAWLRAAYGEARTILEYGSGGSTVMAAEMPGKTVFSVESDPDWAAAMAAWFAVNPPRSTVHLHPVDVGPTKEWGMPRTDKAIRRFPDYPLSVWDRPDFAHPDTVLIDGRFRAACFLTVLFRATAPVTVYFDDYVGRAPYHRVERYVTPAEIRGRMARFDITPQPIPPRDLPLILATYLMKM